MIKKYTPIEIVINCLQSGWEIYTERDSGPAKRLRFFLHKEGESRMYIHHQTMAKLLRDKILLGYEYGHDKYKLNVK